MTLTRKNVNTISTILRYAILIIFAFTFLYPLLYMTLYAFMSADDVINPFVKFIPTKFYIQNFITAFKVLDFVPSIAGSFLIAIPCAIFTCLSTSVTAYGLARYKIPLKKLIFALMLFSFIIPTQSTIIPQIITFTALKLDNVASFIITSALAQGLRAPLFILIFYRYFAEIPPSLIEAGKIDGAGGIKIFFLVAVPLCVSGYVLTFLFSCVWYYNETTLTSLLLGTDYKTLTLSLETFLSSFGELKPNEKNPNEAVYMAGTALSVLPLIVAYFVLQRKFTESIVMAGITGE